jgi:hypothetical protein
MWWRPSATGEGGDDVWMTVVRGGQRMVGSEALNHVKEDD